jgi:hypothetical protein
MHKNDRRNDHHPSCRHRAAAATNATPNLRLLPSAATAPDGRKETVLLEFSCPPFFSALIFSCLLPRQPTWRHSSPNSRALCASSCPTFVGWTVVSTARLRARLFSCIASPSMPRLSRTRPIVPGRTACAHSRGIDSVSVTCTFLFVRASAHVKTYTDHIRKHCSQRPFKVYMRIAQRFK